MKDATIFVVRKQHQGYEVVENVLNYILDSPYADLDDIMSNGTSLESFDQMVADIYNIQGQVNMDHHRAMFHLILSTRPSKASQRIIENGAYALLDYFQLMGYQAVLVPHDGSQGHFKNYHCHIAVNPISFTGERMQDKFETFNHMRDYLNTHTCNTWSWRFTEPKSYNKYIF